MVEGGGGGRRPLPNTILYGPEYVKSIDSKHSIQNKIHRKHKTTKN